MFAIIETGGKQYKVTEQDIIFVEKLNCAEGEEVTFDVVAISTEEGFKVGTPTVEGAKVTAKLIKNGKLYSIPRDKQGDQAEKANIDFKKILSYKRIYRVIIFRLIIYPVLTLITLKLLSFIPVIDGEKILLISFLASIPPAAATVMQFSQINDSDTEYATAINIFTTLACILTMPILVMLFTNI